MGDTTPLGVIEIPNQFQRKPAELAVVLSHEIVHAERHDPFFTPSEYPLWRRIFWHGEEETAHCKSILTALELWRPYPSVWNVLGVQWLLEPFLYVFVAPQSIAAVLILLILIKPKK